MRAFSLFFLTFAACSPKAGAPAVQASGPGPALEELLARDLVMLPKLKTIVGPAGLFVSKAPATADPVATLTNGSAQVSWSIGTREPVQCVVYGQRMNLADILSSTFTTIVGRAPGARLERTDAGELEGEPFLAFDLLYRVDSPQGTGVGELKVLAVGYHALSFICTHDEPGYHTAFKRAVGAFTRHLVVVTDSERATPLYRAIHQVGAGDTRVGFVDSWVEKLGEEELTHNSSLSALVPRADGTLAALDVDTYEVSDATSHLVEAKYTAVYDHGEQASLELTQKDAKSFRLRGSRAGLKVASEFTPAGGLFGEGARERLTATSLAHATQRWSLVTFTPECASPFGETALVVTGEQSGGLPVLREKRCDVERQLTVDPHGHPTSVSLPATTTLPALVMRRVFVAGEPTP